MFRPCIDLHDGRVKQVVGGTFRDADEPVTNFVSDLGAAHFARLFRDDGLTGGHVIMLGPGNDDEARAALATYPDGLQVGGGITLDNAAAWLDAGASHVIVTSWLFVDGSLDRARLDALVERIGRDRLVIDLSCRRRPRATGSGDDDYVVVTDRWTTFTDTIVSEATLAELADRCAELLVHGVDVEGTQLGIDLELVERLAAWSPVPVTYAGGARSLEDLATVDRVGAGRVDLTIGSALDLFGGAGVRYTDAVAYNRDHPR